MNRNLQMGYSIVELVVVVGLLALLLALGVPAMTELIASSRVRTTAEGVLNGLQLARAEAVRNNTLVDLQIGADGKSWNMVAGGATVQTRTAESTDNVTATPAGPVTVTFNGVGQMVSVPYTARFASSVTGARAMCVSVMTHTPRMCDPQRKLPADGGSDLNADKDSQACYVGGTFIAGC